FDGRCHPVRIVGDAHAEAAALGVLLGHFGAVLARLFQPVDHIAVAADHDPFRRVMALVVTGAAATAAAHAVARGVVVPPTRDQARWIRLVLHGLLAFRLEPLIE